MNDLYNGGFSQLNICFVNGIFHAVGDEIANQFTDGGSEIKINRINVFCKKRIGNRPFNGIAYFKCFLLQSKIFKHHGGG